MSTRWEPTPDWAFQPSKRTPDTKTFLNRADDLERLLQADGFTKWGFIIYRCTYESDSDWDALVCWMNQRVRDHLHYHNGLEMLDSFAPTVVQDSSFAGATTTMLRAHFSKWAPAAMLKENPGFEPDMFRAAEPSRYRFFLMVDHASLESVLNARGLNPMGFVRLVAGLWEANTDPEEEEEDHEPLEGSRHKDVGWMNVLYQEVQIPAFVIVDKGFDWELYYERPPKIAEL